MSKDFRKTIARVLVFTLLVAVIPGAFLPITYAADGLLTVYPNPPAGTDEYTDFKAQVRLPGEAAYNDLFAYKARMFNADKNTSDELTGFNPGVV